MSAAMSDSGHEACLRNLESTFGGIPCGSLLHSRVPNPVVLESQMSVSEASKLLSHHAISSAPVVDSETKAIQYMFDFRDICALVVDFLKDPKELELVEENTSFEYLIADTTIEACKVVSKLTGFRSCGMGDSLVKAVTYFGQGIHRVALVGDKHGFEGVISQSDAIKAVYEHQDTLEPVLSQTLEQLGLGKNNVVSTGPDTSVLEALGIMRDHHITSLALIDDGCFIGVLSMTDIKYLFHRRAFQLLKIPVESFISEIRKLQEEEHKKDAYPIFAVRPSSTLAHVIRKLIATRSHRLFVTNTAMKPLGVVSLTDILRALTLQ